jgi:leader peptidase (prepilin peptidase)/N-methyltransferase
MLTRAKQSLYLPRDKAVVAALVTVAGCAACILVTPPAHWLAGCFLSITLAWAALIDIDRMILPDLLTFPLLLAGIANAAFAPAPGLTNSLAGAAVGYAVFIALGRIFSRLLGRPALGQGDAKLLAAGGAWLGWEWLPYVTLIASASALLARGAELMLRPGQRGTDRITFGPYIALGIIGGSLLSAG